MLENSSNKRRQYGRIEEQKDIRNTENNAMVEVKPTLSVMVLNVYRLNTRNKRQRLEERMKKYNADSMKWLCVDYKRQTLDTKTQTV